MKAKNSTYPVVSGDEPIEVIVVLGDQTDASAWFCAERDFGVGGCTVNSKRDQITSNK